MSRKRVAIILVVLAIAATAAYLAVRLLGGEENPPRPPSKASFSITEVRAVDPQDRPESPQRAVEQAAKVVVLLNDYYLRAMLRPQFWVPDPKASPPPPAPVDRLSGFFALEVQQAVAPNIEALGLGKLARSLRRVDPTKQEATKVSIEFEDDGTTPFAVVSVLFEAIGTLREKKETKGGKPVVVSIVHTATLWLVMEADTYKIVAGSAELKADEMVKSAAWGIPPGGHT